MLKNIFFCILLLYLFFCDCTEQKLDIADIRIAFVWKIRILFIENYILYNVLRNVIFYNRIEREFCARVQIYICILRIKNNPICMKSLKTRYYRFSKFAIKIIITMKNPEGSKTAKIAWRFRKSSAFIDWLGNHYVAPFRSEASALI